MDIGKNNKIAELLARNLSGVLSPEERAALDEWSAASAANRAVYDEAAAGALVGNYDRETEGLDSARELAAIRGKIRGRRKRRLIRYAAPAAAVLAAGIFLLCDMARTDGAVEMPAFGLHAAIVTVGDAEPVYLEGVENESAWREVAENTAAGVGNAETPRIRITAPRGCDYKVLLSDGTTVWLNSETTIEYPKEFGGSGRNVRLTGEAYFEVACDEHNPFTVSAANSEIKVSGTSFNVSSYPSADAVTTTLVCGSVDIVCGGNTVRLTPGMQAEVSKTTGKIDFRQVNTSLYTSWTEGFFEFDGMELEDICTQLARWYDVDFSFEGGSGKEMFTGAAWRDKPLKEFLEKIERVTDVSFGYREGRVTVSPRRR